MWFMKDVNLYIQLVELGTMLTRRESLATILLAVISKLEIKAKEQRIWQGYLHDNEIRYFVANEWFEQEDYKEAMPLTLEGEKKAKGGVIEDLV